MWHASRPNWLTALCQAGQPSPRSPYRPDQFPPALGSDLLGPVVGDIEDLDIRLLGCGGIGAWFLDPSPFTVSTSPVGVPAEYRIFLARVKPGLALPKAAPAPIRQLQDVRMIENIRVVALTDINGKVRRHTSPRRSNGEVIPYGRNPGQVPMALDSHLEHGEAVVRVVKGDPFDAPGQRFWRCMRKIHGAILSHTLTRAA